MLRHYCASQMYLNGVDLVAIQENARPLLDHHTMGYVHVQTTRIEQAWIAGQERAAARLEGLI